MAQNFSLALDSVFGLDSGHSELADSIEQKYDHISCVRVEACAHS